MLSWKQLCWSFGTDGSKKTWHLSWIQHCYLPHTDCCPFFLFIILFITVTLKDYWNVQAKKSQIIIKTCSFMTLTDLYHLCSAQIFLAIVNYSVGPETCSLVHFSQNLKWCHLGQPHAMWVFVISHLHQQCICPLLKTYYVQWSTTVPFFFSISCSIIMATWPSEVRGSVVGQEVGHYKLYPISWP